MTLTNFMPQAVKIMRVKRVIELEPRVYDRLVRIRGPRTRGKGNTLSDVVERLLGPDTDEDDDESMFFDEPEDDEDDDESCDEEEVE